MTCDVAIIGGGAAGLFAGCFLKRAGADYLILEKNPECGRKILITGHGRCNITNLKDVRELRNGYHEASNFVYPALSSFPPSKCVDFLQKELQLRLKTEENDRVFPVSDKASDVRDALVRYIGRDSILTGFECISISVNNGMFEIMSAEGGRVMSKKLILACGGMSYPATGSDGSGFRLAQMAGHTIVTPRAALSAVRTRPDFCAALAGVTVENAELTLYDSGEKVSSFSGSLLFTHTGITGPAVMELSRGIPSEPSGAYILADFAKNLTDRVLIDEMDKRPKAGFVNVLVGYVPKRLAEVLSGDTEVRCSGVTAVLRKKVLRELKEARFDIDEAPDVSASYCTRGGVSLSELDRKSFGSKLVEGLYIIGENADVDGISGGYNLAFAAASAHLAVKSIVG